MRCLKWGMSPVLSRHGKCFFILPVWSLQISGPDDRSCSSANMAPAWLMGMWQRRWWSAYNDSLTGEESNRLTLEVGLKRGLNDLPANKAKARAPLMSLHSPFHWGEPLGCPNANLRCSVRICHFPIYISCYYLLGLGLHAVSLRVLDFRQHELSAEEGSSRNHGGTWWCFSSGCPIYQNPKWLQFCGTQQNEEYLMTSFFISTLCYISLLLVFLL